MQQANCYLPFRHTIPFQLGLFLVAVTWAHGMPCWLPVPDQASSSSCSCVGFPEVVANSSTPVHMILQASECEAALAFQQQGTRACQVVDMLHTLVWLPVGMHAGSMASSAPSFCDGAAAFQLLHVFAAGSLTIVVSLFSIYCVEYYCKLHWLRGKNIEVGSWRSQRVPSNRVRTSQESLWWWASREPRWGLRDVSPYALLLLPFSCCWLLGQFLAAGWNGKCEPPLGVGAFAWLSQLY
jgi:hypothetical protein